MAFLDNSGDIILDAVLTDTGRLRLARGDGSFRIAKFALGDDEIDYGKYNPDNTGGSAYYDLEILKTPIFEAFTNNTSTMVSKLISISRTNLLYLPIIKLNTLDPATKTYSTLNTFLVTADNTTSNAITDTDGLASGILLGDQATNSSNFIRLDQGLDTVKLSATNPIDADLKETQYIIEMDNRFGSLTSKTGVPADISFVDDDNIASYFISQGATSAGFITNLPRDTGDTTETGQTIVGPRGTAIEFKVQSSVDLQGSNYLFTTLGSTDTIGSTPCYILDTTIKVTGATTGYRVDVPVRFIKKI
tara:strand:+ start:1026 stop:1940 length:915 start_codon:yes stop_codon:yes gene_type:complete